MPKSLKILIIIAIVLAVISGIFLLTAKKKTSTASLVQNSAPSQPIDAGIQGTSAQKLASSSGAKLPIAPGNQKTKKDLKKFVADEWHKCKDRTLSPSSNMFWKVKITEGIPAGGTYAKGLLMDDSLYPVHVVIKSDSKIVDKLKQMLVVGNNSILRINCTDVASDGSVVVQAF